jgi:hypothetical protein
VKLDQIKSVRFVSKGTEGKNEITFLKGEKMEFEGGVPASLKSAAQFAIVTDSSSSIFLNMDHIRSVSFRQTPEEDGSINQNDAVPYGEILARPGQVMITRPGSPFVSKAEEVPLENPTRSDYEHLRDAFQAYRKSVRTNDIAG